MRPAFRFMVMLALSLPLFGQDQLPTFATEARSAFVWGEDYPNGAVSSSARDPLAGTTIAKLTYGGVEVSSRMGFELIGNGEPGEFLNYTSTIVNSTHAPFLVRYGGATIDGHNLLPLTVALPDKTLKRKQGQSTKGLVEHGKMYCFMNGFLSEEHLFSSETSSLVLKVSPGAALTVSSVFKDPRHYSLRCSVEGCYPTGAIRYYLTVASRDYVFVWPGRSLVYCGK